jgi:hypothetical protein
VIVVDTAADKVTDHAGGVTVFDVASTVVGG